MDKAKYFFKSGIEKVTNPPGEIKKPLISGIALVTEGANEEEFLFIKQKNLKKEKTKMDKELAKKLIVNKSLKADEVEAIFKQVDEKDIEVIKEFRKAFISKSLDEARTKFIKSFDEAIEKKIIEKVSVEEINGLVDKVMKAGDNLFFDALPILDATAQMLMTSAFKLQKKNTELEKGEHEEDEKTKKAKEVQKEKHAAFGAFVSAKKVEMGKTVEDMAEATGWTVEQLEALFTGEFKAEDLTPEFMEKLAKFLEMEIEMLRSIMPKSVEAESGDPETVSEKDLEDL